MEEIYELFHEQFVQVLPMCNSGFVEKLSEHGLFSEDMKVAAQSVSTQVGKTLLFLDNIIKPGIMIGDDENFNKLLIVMENCEFANVKVLASQIRNKMDTKIGWSCIQLYYTV